MPTAAFPRGDRNFPRMVCEDLLSRRNLEELAVDACGIRGCEECSNGACSKCSSNLKLSEESTCGCDPVEFNHEGTCKPCSQKLKGCAVCSQNGSKCLECLHTFLLSSSGECYHETTEVSNSTLKNLCDIQSEYGCVEKCDAPNQVLTLELNQKICKSCSENCLKCSEGMKGLTCQKCPEGLTAKGNKCI